MTSTTATVSNTMRSDIQISATPIRSIMDQVVSIEASRFIPKEPITIRTYLNDEGKQFESHAHFSSNDKGIVNTMTHHSQGGKYTGVDPMGLFWSMSACPNHRLGTRYMKNDVSKPFIINITVHSGHLDATTCRQDKNILASTTVERLYMSENVERIPVHHGRLRGSLLKPKGTGPFPAIIDMFGGVRPGCNEIRAALLAGKGYAVLALAYYGEEGQPGTLDQVDALHMEYFEEAADWLLQLPFVESGGIATVGICKGGEMALSMAIHFPQKIRATVAISTSCMLSVCPNSYKGQRYPSLDYEATHGLLSPEKQEDVQACLAQACFTDDGALIIKRMKMLPDENYIQKFEKIQCPALIINGDQDQSMRSGNSRIIYHRIRTNEHNNRCELITYKGAGHLIEPPYAPICTMAFQPPWGLIEWGGIPADHNRAQEEAWRELLAFLEDTLRRDRVCITTSKL